MSWLYVSLFSCKLVNRGWLKFNELLQCRLVRLYISFAVCVCAEMVQMRRGDQYNIQSFATSIYSLSLLYPNMKIYWVITKQKQVEQLSGFYRFILYNFSSDEFNFLCHDSVFLYNLILLYCNESVYNCWKFSLSRKYSYTNYAHWQNNISPDMSVHKYIPGLSYLLFIITAWYIVILCNIT